MADFTITTRIKKVNGKFIIPENGLITVYISVMHNGITRYINTGLTTKFSDMRKGRNRLGNTEYIIRDTQVINECMILINKYSERANRIEYKDITCGELVKIIVKETSSPSFVEYANLFIGKKQNRGEDRYRKYRTSLRSYLSFVKKEDVTFEDIDSKTINRWIDTLKETKRAKEQYPSLLKTMFRTGADYYNDYDRGVLLVKNDPFRRARIPKSDVPSKRSIDKETLLKFFNYTPNETSLFGNTEIQSRESVSHDVAKLVFFLVGINTADLYHLKKNEYKNGKICYNRRKTKGTRTDSAYIEVMVPDEIKPLFEKYKGKDEFLFNFHERHTSQMGFNEAINRGLKVIAKNLELNNLTTYTFRHTWATIAQNHCDATIADVAFALNHSSNHKITELYIDIDYSPIDRLNRKVIDYVFNYLLAK